MAYPETWPLAPVDIAAAAAAFGITITYWRPREKLLNGVLIRSERTIFVNETLPLSRARFTAAHELGHYVLGHAGDYFCYTGWNTPQEREANRFAAALLMPAAVVKALWLKLAAVPRPAKVAAAARRLSVSQQALRYRLATLALTAHETFTENY